MGIALDKAAQDYAKEITASGFDGKPLGEALFSGFLDGFQQGHKSHANMTVQALQVLLNEFQEPVTIKSAHERVEQLMLAIKHGGGL